MKTFRVKAILRVVPMGKKVLLGTCFGPVDSQTCAPLGFVAHVCSPLLGTVTISISITHSLPLSVSGLTK